MYADGGAVRSGATEFTVAGIPGDEKPDGETVGGVAAGLFGIYIVDGYEFLAGRTN